MHRILVVIFCVFIAASAGGLFWLYQSEAEKKLQLARDEYDYMRLNVYELNKEQDHLQTSLTSLQNHVESVELRAREQYRLVKPGEHIAMIKANHQ